MTSFPNVFSDSLPVELVLLRAMVQTQHKLCSDVCPAPDSHKDIFKMMLKISNQ